VNITESNHVSLLLRALNGDPEVDAFDVATAAVACKAAVHKALSASPSVLEGLVVANVVHLQAFNEAEPEAVNETLKDINGTATDEQKASARQARRELQDATGAKPSDNPTTKAPAKPKGAARKTAQAKADYDKRVADQTKVEVKATETEEQKPALAPVS
jgi:hypothetical protein